MSKKMQKKKITLEDRRNLNRKVIWPQRKINRLIYKYDQHLIRSVKGNNYILSNDVSEHLMIHSAFLGLVGIKEDKITGEAKIATEAEILSAIQQKNVKVKSLSFNEMLQRFQKYDKQNEKIKEIYEK